MVLCAVFALFIYALGAQAKSISLIVNLFSKKQIEIVIVSPIPTPVSWTMAQKLLKPKIF